MLGGAAASPSAFFLDVRAMGGAEYRGARIPTATRVERLAQVTLAALVECVLLCAAMADMAEEPVDVDSLMEQFHAYLTKQGLKSTRQRDMIAERFFATNGHTSIEELLALAREDAPKVGYATVYRTLKLLTECGLAAERRFGEGQTTYETAGDTEHHDHLICIECGHVLEFHNEAIEREQERVARSFGFNVVRHRHELYGLCPRARGIKGGSCPGQEASEKKPAR